MDSLTQFADRMAKNPWILLFVSCLTVLGFVLAIIFYFKSKRIKRINYMWRSQNIINSFRSKIQGLSVSYNNKGIADFTITKFAFWNEGNVTIEGADITIADPLLIKPQRQLEILKAEIISFNNIANKIDLKTIEDKIFINFDYLDPYDGAVIRITHTGQESKDLTFDGTIKGMGKVKVAKRQGFSSYIVYGSNKISSKVLELLQRYYSQLAVIIIIIPIAMFVLSLIFYEKDIIEYQFLLVTAVITAFVYWPSAYYFLKRRTPKGFESFESDNF